MGNKKEEVFPFLGKPYKFFIFVGLGHGQRGDVRNIHFVVVVDHNEIGYESTTKSWLYVTKHYEPKVQSGPMPRESLPI